MKINTTHFTLKERHIYGSSRVGIRNSDVDLLPLSTQNYSMKSVYYSIGWFLQPSCNPNGGRILEQNSIIITSSGVVVSATSELDCARGVTH